MAKVISAVDERRTQVSRAFAHLVEFAATVDLSSISDPKQQWLAMNRAMVPHYGEVGDAPDFKDIVYTPVSADGVRAEWVTAKGGSDTRRIVWIHGGGWTAGSPADYRGMSGTLARLSGASILMIDYRLAPEHPFPAGLDDCVKAYKWAITNGPQGGKAESVDRDPAEWISLMGDSAGGNLAAATCLRLASTGDRMPDRLALIAATLDNISNSERIGLDDPICSLESFANTVAFYLTSKHHPADPYVSPVFARKELLAQFPPTLLQVSTSEALLYDSKKFASRLEKAGVRINLSLWPELPHVWHAFLGLLPEATAALAEVADFSKKS